MSPARSTPQAAARLVLGPLGMTSSTFPASWPHEDPDAVTGYELEPDGTFVPDLDEVAAIPAAAGLWTTAADLVRFGTGWSSLLPDDLAADALRPQAPTRPVPAGSASAGASTRRAASPTRSAPVPAGPASLIVKPGDSHAYVALTNRKVAVTPLNVRVFLQSS